MGYNESCSSRLPSSFAPRESKVRLPVGFRFDPGDGELIKCFLLPRCLGKPLPVDIIPDIQDPYQHPSTLKRPFEFAVKNESYFFTKWKQRSDGDTRKRRSIKGAFWKTTSDPMPVHYGKKMVGHKKRFTWHVDKDKGQKLQKTDWIMHEYTMDVSYLVGDGKRMFEEFVLCKLYNNKKSSSDSPNVRSDPPCPFSPDITSSRVPRQDVYYNDNGAPFVSQTINVDTPKVGRDAVDALLINNDNQVQHSAPLSGANLSSTLYAATQDMSWLGTLQKEVEPCYGAAHSVLPQFSHGMTSPYTSQVMEVYNQTLMNVDPQVQNPLQLSNAELSSATYSSSQNMASLEIHSAIPYCNPAIPSATQLGNDALVESSEMMEELDGWQSSMNEVHPQQHAPQHQRDMSLADRLYSNDYPQQSGDMHEAYTHQGKLQTFQVQPYALRHDEAAAQADMSFNSFMQSGHHLMNNSQQQHAPQHDEDYELLVCLLGGFEPQEESQGIEQLMNDSAN